MDVCIAEFVKYLIDVGDKTERILYKYIYILVYKSKVHKWSNL